MGHLIDKDALVAEIEKLISNGKVKCQQSQENNDQVSYIAWSEHIATCGKILLLLDTLEVKEVDLENEVDKDGYWNLFKDCTKLNIDSTTEINFDESTEFNLYDYIKMKEQEKTNSSKFYKRIFKNIPTVSMKIFSWWNRNKRKENKL